MGNGKTADFSSATYSAHARHALLFATNSCTRKVFFKRGNEPMHAVRWLASPRQGEKILLNDFWYFSSLKSTRKEKLLHDSSRANNVRPYHVNLKYSM